MPGAWVRNLAAGSVVAAALLAVLVAPGWRHRHAGDVAHGHSHAHGPGHAHPHAHPHPHDGAATGRSGWHVHLSFFGYEWTLWEPTDAAISATALAADEEPSAVDGDSASSAVPAVRADGRGGVSWASLFRLEPAPLTAALRLPRPGVARGTPEADGRFASRTDAPPTPPPKAA